MATMATQQLTLPGEIVKKHNELVRSKIDISSVQGSKILASLIACISTDDTKFKDAYRIAVKDFLPDLGGGNYKQIKSICTELRKSGVTFEIKDPDNEPYFITISFFSRIEYRKGIIEARFNTSDPILENCLINLQNQFTKYNLIEYLKLPSIYSQRIFEILKSWINSKTGEIIITIAKLHQMLNTPPSFQADFRPFRKYVLEKAHKDIIENTSLRFEWEPIKEGKSVDKIRFVFNARRVATTEKVKSDSKEEKRQRLADQRLLRAIACAKKKNGVCSVEDNVRIVCRICAKFRCCESMQRQLKHSGV